MAENEQDSSILKVLVELVDEITEPLHAVHEKFEEFEGDVWSLASAWSSAFLGYELFEHLIEPASEFQDQQVKLALATNASAEQLAEFKDQAADLAAKYPSSIEEVTAAQTELYKTFRDTEGLKESTELAAKLGLVLGVNAQQGASILASAYENLGDSTKPANEEMTYLANKLSLLTTTFPMSGAGASRMALDMARIGASARTYGININQVFATLGELNRLHVGGARGAGQFAEQLIHSLAAVDKNGTPELAKYGLQIVKTTDGHLNLIETIKRLSEMNPRALQRLTEHLPGQAQAITQLVAHVGELEGAYHEFVGSTGDVSKAAEALGATWSLQMARTKNAWSDLLDVFGTLALPILTDLLIHIRDIIKGMEDWATHHETLAKGIAIFAGLAAAAITIIGIIGAIGATIGFVSSGLEVLGPLIEGVGGGIELVTGAVLAFGEGFAAAFTEAGIAMELTPIGWVITGIAAIAFASYEVYKHWDGIKGIINDIIAPLAKLDAVFGISDAALGIHQLQRAGASDAGGVGPLGGYGTAGSRSTSSGDVHLHYMEGATVTIGGDGGSESTSHAVQQMLSGHSQDLEAMLQERDRQQDRVSFSDSSVR